MIKRAVPFCDTALYLFLLLKTPEKCDKILLVGIVYHMHTSLAVLDDVEERRCRA